MTKRLQLCEDGTSLQLCEDGVSLQLCPEEAVSCPCPDHTGLEWPPAWPWQGMAQEYQLDLTYRYRHWNTADCSGTPDVDCTQAISITLLAAGWCIYGNSYITASCPDAGRTMYIALECMDNSWQVQIGIVGFATAEATSGVLIGFYTPSGSWCVQTNVTESIKLEIVSAEIS